MIGSDGGPFEKHIEQPLSWETFDPRTRWIIRAALGAKGELPISIDALRTITWTAILSVNAVGAKRGRAAWEELQRVITTEDGIARGEYRQPPFCLGCQLPSLPTVVADSDVVRLVDLDPSVAWIVERLFEQNEARVPERLSLRWLTALEMVTLQAVDGVGALRAADAIAYLAECDRLRTRASSAAEALCEALASAPPKAAAALDSLAIDSTLLPEEFGTSYVDVLERVGQTGHGLRWVLTATALDLCAAAGLDGPSASDFVERRDECFSHAFIAKAILIGGDPSLVRIAATLKISMSGKVRWSSGDWETQTGLSCKEFVPMARALLCAVGKAKSTQEWSYIEDVEMLDELRAGATLKMVGAKRGLSRERVRQRVLRLGYQRNIDLSETRDRLVDTENQFRLVVEGFVRSHPGCTPSELANAVGVPLARVAKECERLNWLTISDASHDEPGSVTAARLRTASRSIKALREAATLAYPLKKLDYDNLRANNFINGPSSSRILQVFGSWRLACEAAGIECGKSPRRAGHNLWWSRSELIDIVSKYLLDPAYQGQAEHYQQWRESHPASADLPSFTTIQNNLRIPWVQTRILALRRARQSWELTLAP